MLFIKRKHSKSLLLFPEFQVDDIQQVQDLALSRAVSAEVLEYGELDDSNEINKDLLRNPIAKKIIKKIAKKVVQKVAKKALCKKETCRKNCNKQKLNGQCVIAKCVCWKWR